MEKNPRQCFSSVYETVGDLVSKETVCCVRDNVSVLFIK